MKTFLTYYLKYIILGVLSVIVLSIVGAINIKKTVDVENRKASYARTQFDYFISSPDKAQVEEIENSASVDKVFPYYALSNAFTDKSAKDVFLLLSDKTDDAGISLFTEKTCVSGSFDKNGAMLDVLAAKTLGVKVGDTVTFGIKGRQFTRKVSGLYLTSTYGALINGVALVDYSADIQQVYKPNAYGAAFIKSNDVNGLKALLTEYVGEGNVALSYEQYVALNYPTKPPYQSQEEYEASCQAKYREYRTDCLEKAKKGGAQVTAKADAYALVQDKVNTTEKNVNSANKWAGIASLLLFTLVSIIFIVTNIGNDRIRRDDGMSFLGMAGLYALITLITAAVAGGLTLGILYVIASKTFFMDVCIKTVLWFSLGPVVAIPLVIAAAFAYALILYSGRV